MENASSIVRLSPRGRSPISKIPAPNVYLIVGQTAVLFDSGLNHKDTIAANLRHIHKTGAKLEYIIISHHHRDHSGGAPLIRERTGARIVAHPLEAAKLDYKIDLLVEDGYRLDMGGAELELIHTPGHSPGHLCAYLAQSKTLFSGDQILGLGTTAIMPPDGDMAQYIDSLRRLLGYDIEVIYPGHALTIHAARRKIEELIEHRLEREKQVLKLFRRGTGNVDKMVAEIYPELEQRLTFMAKGQIQAHLVKLEKEGWLSSR